MHQEEKIIQMNACWFMDRTNKLLSKEYQILAEFDIKNMMPY